MTEPRLTIGIPTLDRPGLLGRAIDSALRQTTPAKVIVADQGHSPETAHVVSKFLQGEHAHLVRHVKTDAACIWDNWRAAAMLADTEFFAWLQDDDIVSGNYVKRLTSCFDQFPDANCWIARLATASAPDHAIWFAPNGPMVPCDLLSGRPCLVEGRLFPPLCYFTSFGMSPAVAFRVGDTFTAAMASVPSHCDLFTERMILAAMGLKGPIICDPVIAGLWIMHGENESKRQHASQQRQVKILYEWADAAMRACPDWEEYFVQWASVMPDMHLVGFLNELNNPTYDNSEFAPKVRDILVGMLVHNGAITKNPPDSMKTLAKDWIIFAARTVGRIRNMARRGLSEVVDTHPSGT